jgi:predicted unusual protein kinase regulating ubiquinone biosynthesis (AarF/ABC1/UbiB family)
MRKIRYKEFTALYIMEILTILGIGISECVKRLWTGSFDTLSFWMRCMRVNVIYAKFFQAVALHYDLADEISSIPYSEDELCIPKGIPIKGVLGTGLISIVFEGELDGVPVVIKTKRRNIEQRVYQSLATIGRCIQWIHWWTPCPILVSSYDEICENFKTQLDFDSEYKNQALFIETYKSMPYVHIPKLYPEWCNSDQLVMTKIEGIQISQLSEEEKVQTVIWLAKVCLYSLLKFGCFHADLHAGNIIFNKESIGVIDFGLVIRLTEEERDIFYGLLKEFSSENLKGAALQTLRMTAPVEIQKNLTPEEADDISQFIIRLYEEASEDHRFFSVYDILKINKYLNRYNLSISNMFYKVVVSLNSIETVLQKLSATTTDFIVCAITDSSLH